MEYNESNIKFVSSLKKKTALELDNLTFKSTTRTHSVHSMCKSEMKSIGSTKSWEYTT